MFVRNSCIWILLFSHSFLVVAYLHCHLSYHQSNSTLSRTYIIYKCRALNESHTIFNLQGSVTIAVPLRIFCSPAIFPQLRIHSISMFPAVDIYLLSPSRHLDIWSHLSLELKQQKYPMRRNIEHLEPNIQSSPARTIYVCWPVQPKKRYFPASPHIRLYTDIWCKCKCKAFNLVIMVIGRVYTRSQNSAS